MKKWVKGLLIGLGTLFGVAAIATTVSVLVITKKTVDHVDETVNNIPNTPNFDISMPTLNSVKQNYNVNSLGVNVEKANLYSVQKPTELNTNIYNIEL